MNNKNSVKVTIIIPAYNEETGIKKTLNKIMENINNDSYEIIVVDDYSKDKTAEIVSSFDNLLNEGIEKKSICVVGNTVIDSLLETSKKIDLEYEKYINYFNDNYKVTFNNFKTILVTGHRRESFGDGFENICHALKKISKYNKVQIIYPLHLNPNVQEPVKRILGKIKNIYLIKPLDYLPFIFLMKNSYLILTDSGGVQEEAPSLGKPVLVMRDNTERPEGISSGTSKLVGTSVKEITKNVQRLLTNKKKYNSMAQSVNPYGDGFAANKIYKHILSNL